MILTSSLCQGLELTQLQCLVQSRGTMPCSLDSVLLDFWKRLSALHVSRKRDGGKVNAATEIWCHPKVNYVMMSIRRRYS